MVEKCSMAPNKGSGWMRSCCRIRVVNLFDREYVYVIHVDERMPLGKMFC